MEPVATTYSDRRQHTRVEIIQSVFAALNLDGLSVTCRLRDISLSGARVTIDHPVDMEPGIFRFIFDGVSVAVEVVWRSVRELGLRFAEASPEENALMFERIVAGAYGGNLRRCG